MAVMASGSYVGKEDGLGQWCAELRVDEYSEDDDYYYVRIGVGMSTLYADSGAWVGYVGDALTAVVSIVSETTGATLWSKTVSTTVQSPSAGSLVCTVMDYVSVSIPKMPYDQTVVSKVALTKAGDYAVGTSNSQCYSWITASTKTFANPTVTVSASAITSFPWSVSWVFADKSAPGLAPLSTTLTVEDTEGNVVYTKTSGFSYTPTTSSGAAYSCSASIDSGDAVIASGTYYTATVVVTAATRYQGSGSKTVASTYTPPAVPTLSLSEVEDTAAVVVSVAAGEKESTSTPDTASISVYRDGTLIASGVAPGGSVTDSIPTLDAETTYYVIAYDAAGGNAKSETLSITVASNSYAYFSSGATVAKMRLNLEPKESAEPEYELFQVMGRTAPVAMYGTHVTKSGTVEADSWWLEDLTGDGERTMLEAWRAIAAVQGPIYMRLPRGETRRIAASVNISRGGTYGLMGISVDWTEVAR